VKIAFTKYKGGRRSLQPIRLEGDMDKVTELYLDPDVDKLFVQDDGAERMVQLK